MNKYSEKELDARLEALRAKLREIDKDLNQYHKLRLKHSKGCIDKDITGLEDELGGVTFRLNQTLNRVVLVCKEDRDCKND